MIRNLQNCLRHIERRLQIDEGNRGISHLVPESPQLYTSCIELIKCKTVGILTGFPCFVDRDLKIESDGIGGALCIARALNRIGIRSTILIDPCFLRHIEPILQWHNQEFACEIGLSSSMDLEFEGIVSIERAGRGKDGNYYTMRAIKMTDLTELDTNYLDNKPCQVRVAIGDGGNEAGLGLVYDQVTRFIKNGEIIASCSMSDFVLISSVSTWGGYSLSLALSLVSGTNVVLSVEDEEKVTRKIMENHICDGILGIPHMGVDGLEWISTQKFIEDIIHFSQNDMLQVD